MWFKKKIEAKVELKTFTCDHNWKDFGITTETIHSVDGTFLLKVYKHYACIWCKEYKRVLLVTDWCKNKEELDKKEKEVEALHHVEYDSIVMERIYDFQLLDKEYLEVARRLFPNRGY